MNALHNIAADVALDGWPIARELFAKMSAHGRDGIEKLRSDGLITKSYFHIMQSEGAEAAKAFLELLEGVQ